MSSSSDEFMNSTPPEVSEAAKKATLCLLPVKSTDRYLQAYQTFITWKSSKNANLFLESVFLAYFIEFSQKYKSSSLWCYYLMLKSTVKTKHGIDIKSYSNLLTFLKRRSSGHVSKKSKVFSADNVKKFLKEPPNCRYLATKLSSSAKIDRWFSLLPTHAPTLSRPESGFISGVDDAADAATWAEVRNFILQLGTKKKRRFMPIRFTRKKTIANNHTLL